MKENTELFEKMPVPKALRTMIIPAAISQIIVLIYNMADTFYIGRTGNPYMVAGVSLLLPVFNITISIVAIAGAGGGTLISRLLGVGKNEEARKVSSFSIWLSVFMTLIFSAFLGLFLDPILMFLGAGENTLLYSRQYAFMVIVIGGIPTVLSNVMSNLLRSVGLSKKASIGIMAGGILNIILDPLFMFLILPPGLEVLGVGIATLLSNSIACVYFIITILRSDTVINFRPGQVIPEGKSIGAVFAVGVPGAIATLLFDIDYMVIDKLMAGYSDIALAAIGIVLKAERFPLNVGIGICQGMTPLVAYNYSSGNHKRMDELIRLSLKVGLIIAGVSIILYEIFASGISGLFISEPQTRGFAAEFLRIRVLATPFMFLSFFPVHLFQAFGKGHISFILGIIRWLVLNIPMLFILNALFGLYGIVWSQITADVINVIISWIIYRGQRTRISSVYIDREA